MVEEGSPTVRRRRLAAELRQLREAKGRSGESVANALRWSPSKISRYERAKTGLRPKEVERLLDYYGVGGTRRISSTVAAATSPTMQIAIVAASQPNRRCNAREPRTIRIAWTRNRMIQALNTRPFTYSKIDSSWSG